MNIEYASVPCFFPGTPTWLPGVFDETTGAVTKPNGKVLSVQPNGDYGERDAVGGSYEQFKRDQTLNVLWVTPAASYAIPYRTL
jgi:hypothetical protein